MTETRTFENRLFYTTVVTSGVEVTPKLTL
jgi:hypothetical protein